MGERVVSVLIATPCYGGMLTANYVRSLLETTSWLDSQGITWQHYTLSNESLIPRGRNTCAWYALAFGPLGQPFSHTFFIDADISWTLADFQRLLLSDKRVIGGTYPLKRYPIEFAINSLPEYRGAFGAKRDLDEIARLRKEAADEEGDIPMLHLPTGFLCIQSSVFVDLIPHVAAYYGTDWSTGQKVRLWDFFPIGVREPGGLAYESEDWAFCSLVRKHLGEQVWLSPQTLLPHTGTHTFKPGRL